MKGYVRYLPQTVLDELHRFAADDLSDSAMWSLTRLAERLYADGYDAGHRRGYDEGADHQKRADQYDAAVRAAELPAEPLVAAPHDPMN